MSEQYLSVFIHANGFIEPQRGFYVPGNIVVREFPTPLDLFDLYMRSVPDTIHRTRKTFRYVGDCGPKRVFIEV